MNKTKIKEEEFLDEGLIYIKVFYSDGSILIKQKDGVIYPSSPKTQNQIDKEEYSALSTNTEKIDILAKKLGLK